MVQFADKQIPSPVNRVGSALESVSRIGSHFDDLLTSPEKLSKERLADELASELWSRLPISRVGNESVSGDLDRIIRIATASSTQVSVWYQELQAFVSAIAVAATEHRGEELTETLRAELSAEMRQQVLEPVRYPLPNRSFVDFKFADLPPAEAWTQANRNLERACLEFANQVFALFDQFQSKKLIGEIQETSSTCRFTYFRRVAIAETAQEKTDRRFRHAPEGRPFGGSAFLEETVRVTDFAIQHRHAQYVHHVRNLTLSEPNATTHPLPAKYCQLIDACPDWLAGSVRVLEGDLFREERIEWDLQTETRTAEKVIERVRRDPAVLFGSYVLAGWGELAIAEEESRQRDVQIDAARKTSAKNARLCHYLSFVVAGSATAIIPLTGWTTTATTSFAILLGLVAMVLAGTAAHLTLVARGNLAALHVLLHSTLIGATIFALQAVLFSLVHWSLPALGISALAATVAAVTFTMKSASTTWEGFSVG